MTFRRQLMLSASPRVMLVCMIANLPNKGMYYDKVIKSAMKGCLWLPKVAKS